MKRIKLLILLSSLFIIGCQSIDKKFYPYHFDLEKNQTITKDKKVFLVPTQYFVTERAEPNSIFKALDLSIKASVHDKNSVYS